MKRLMFFSAALIAIAALFFGCDDEPAPSSAPKITSVTPNSGEPGISVTIQGTNFSNVAAENEVKFNGTIAVISQSTTTALTVVVPQGASTGKVTVKRGAHTATSTSDFTVLAPSPQVASFTPEGGTVGTEVTISGTNFSAVAANNAVYFNDVPVTTIVSATATQLVVKVPAGFNTGKIKVVVGGSTALSAQNFTFLTPQITEFSPTSGKKNETVTITGLNFSNATVSANINGKDAEIIEATATSLKVKVPSGASSGKIQVTVNGATATSAQDFEYLNVYTVSTFVGGVEGDLDGQGTGARISTPWGIDASTNHGLVLTLATDKVKKISSTGTVTHLAGGDDFGNEDGTGTDAYFHFPSGVKITSDGFAYITDSNNHRIRKVSIGTGQTTTFVGSTSGFADGTGAAAKFHAPRAIVQDAQGNFYVVDAGNNRIRKITPQGVVTTLAGGATSGNADGNGSDARFNNPSALTIDSEGNVYVADTHNHRIRKITPDGTVTTFAGSSVGSNDGVGTGATFNYPLGITIDEQGNLYVADAFSNSIRKVTPQAKVITIAGGGVGGNVDGDGSEAKFNLPTQLAYLNGILYVCDRGNHTVRKIVIE